MSGVNSAPNDAVEEKNQFSKLIDTGVVFLQGLTNKINFPVTNEMSLQLILVIAGV